MAVAKVVNAQRDFSAGEPDPSIKRGDDHPKMKAGARQMSNWRILNTRALKNRPGRRVLFLDAVSKRVDEVVMPRNNLFRLAFSNQFVRVYNAAGALVFDSGAVLEWTPKLIVWDVFEFSIFMACEGAPPQVITWDGVSQTSAWGRAAYTEDIFGQPFAAQKRTPFYRLSPRGVKLQPTEISGAINLNFTAGMNLTAAHIGTQIRYIGRQITITDRVTSTLGRGQCVERLFQSQVIISSLGIATPPSVVFAIGDEVIGQTTGLRGEVIDLNVGGGAGMTVQWLQAQKWVTAEVFVGPNGSLLFDSADAPNIPGSTLRWDDEVMNVMRGYPASVFVDQGRVGFCDFPALPGLVAWSALGNAYDQYTDEKNAGPTNAIQELVPGNDRVRYVVPGTESSEFVLCDKAIYYVPITQANPLQPGSVAFNQISTDGAAQVIPQRAAGSIIYVGAGLKQIKIIQAVGAYSRPYVIDDASENYEHLLDTPIALAIPSTSNQFEESYIYLLNDDSGSILMGKYNIKGGLVDPASISWLPWSPSSGGSQWISAQGANVIVTGLYIPNNIAPVRVIEQIDDDYYLDAAVFYNNLPTALTPPVGKGPLWWLAGGSVDLMDGPLGTRMMGTYLIDADGFLIPQGNAGEDFTSVNLRVGQTWTAILEPFVPAVQPGQDVNQRLRKRRIQRHEVYVQNSSGFTLVRFFGGPVTPTSPAIGTVMALRRITAWNQDDDPTQPPPLREQTYFERPIGRLHDPRVGLIKDTPGPLLVLEVDMEVSV